MALELAVDNIEPPKKKRAQRKPKSKPVVIPAPTPVPRAAWIVAGATGGLLALSFWHLVTGVQLITGSTWPEAAAMASGIDVMFVAVELLTLTAPPEKVEHLTAHIMVGSTISVSTIMNAVGFATNAPDGWKIAAGTFGAMIPALLYGGTRLLARAAK